MHATTCHDMPRHATPCRDMPRHARKTNRLEDISQKIDLKINSTKKSKVKPLNHKNPVSIHLDHEELEMTGTLTNQGGIVCRDGGANVDIYNYMNKPMAQTNASIKREIENQAPPSHELNYFRHLTQGVTTIESRFSKTCDLFAAS